MLGTKSIDVNTGSIPQRVPENFINPQFRFASFSNVIKFVYLLRNWFTETYKILTRHHWNHRQPTMLRNILPTKMEQIHVLTCYTLHIPLQWRHNGLLGGLFGRRSKKTPKLRVTGLCEGNSPVTGEFPHKGPVTRRMFPVDDIFMSSRKMLSFRWLSARSQCVINGINAVLY